MHHHAQLVFVFLLETGFHHIGQACLELLISGDLSTLASKSAGIAGMVTVTMPSLLYIYGEREREGGERERERDRERQRETERDRER